MRESSLLYNMKCHFPILKTYLNDMEEKNKKNGNKKMINFQSKSFPALCSEAFKIDDIICQICNSGDNDDKNLIVYCSLCNISVHQNCYILPEIPEGDFICDLCIQFGPRGKFLRCVFCSCRGGAMRPTYVPCSSCMFDRKNENFSLFIKSKEPEKEQFWPEKYPAFVEQLQASKSKGSANGSTVGEVSNALSFNKQVINFIPSEKDKKDKKSSSKNKKKIEQKKLKHMVGKQPVDVKELPQITEFVYDFYKETFVFSEEQLQEEPIPEFYWVHMACLYWQPGITIKHMGNEFDVKNFGSVDRSKFLLKCKLCDQVNGACINCSHEECNVSFHVECARRAKLHLVVKPNGAHVGFCVDHTPLLFKNIVLVSEKRQREEILKMIRILRRFLKAKKIALKEREAEFKEEDEVDYSITHEEPKSRNLRKTEKREPKVKIDPSEFLRFIDFACRRVLSNIKHALKDEYDYFDRIMIKRSEKGWELKEVVFQKKSFLENRIFKTNPVFAAVAKKMDTSASYVYNTYQMGFTAIQNFIQQNGVVKMVPPIEQEKIIQAEKETSEQKTEETDDKVHCLCRRPWKGELMISCERCEAWFHPECINVKQIPESDLVNFYVLCTKCRQEYEKDFGEIGLVNPEIYLL